jgi:hypothetical protein
LLFDVNGDGNADIVSSYKGSPWIAFANGDGTFAKSVEQGLFPLQCEDYTHDWNGDGWPDALCYDKDVSLTRAFSIASDGSTQTIFSVATPAAPVVGDIDGDGRLDFAYVVGATFAFQLNEGSGQFGVVMTAYTAESTLQELWLGDIAADWHIDAVVTVATSSMPRIARVLRNKGAGTFELWNTLISTQEFSEFADVTGDGLMDAVMTQDSQVLISVGHGDGTFDAAPVAVSGPWTTTHAIHFDDVTGSGKPALIVGEYNVSVLLRQ